MIGRLYNQSEMKRIADEYHERAAKDIPKLAHEVLHDKVLADINWQAMHGMYIFEKDYKGCLISDDKYLTPVLGCIVSELRRRGFRAEVSSEGSGLSVTWGG